MYAYRHPCALAAAALLAGCAQFAAGNSDEREDAVRSLLGAPADTAEMRLSALGYRVGESEGDLTIWTAPGGGGCARIATADGVIVSVTTIPPETCG